MSAEAKDDTSERYVWVLERNELAVACDLSKGRLAANRLMTGGGSIVRYVPAVEQACAAPAPSVEAWVPVSDRLPEDAFTRLVVGPGGYRTVAYYEQGEWWRIGSLGPERFEVRYWMPLPPPPKESR